MLFRQRQPDFCPWQMGQSTLVCSGHGLAADDCLDGRCGLGYTQRIESQRAHRTAAPGAGTGVRQARHPSGRPRHGRARHRRLVPAGRDRCAGQGRRQRRPLPGKSCSTSHPPTSIQFQKWVPEAGMDRRPRLRKRCSPSQLAHCPSSLTCTGTLKPSPPAPGSGWRLGSDWRMAQFTPSSTLTPSNWRHSTFSREPLPPQVLHQETGVLKWFRAHELVAAPTAQVG